jgi:predicted amidophosphoribosyltransferase
VQQLGVVTQDTPERVTTIQERALPEPISNFCNSCGEPIDQKMGYCMRCGAAFEVVEK